MLLDCSRYQRPVLILGGGVQCCREEAVEFAERLGWPVALTWGAIDLMPSDHPLNLGGFGTHALRAPNFAVQNADFLLTIGTRLDTKATGTPMDSFARAARIYMVDIDQAEIDKFGHRVDGYRCSSRVFFYTVEVKSGPLDAWKAHIASWQARWPIPHTGPYEHVLRLSDAFGEGDVIVSDTGHALAWCMQALRFKKGQRFVHAFNNTPMGYGLPAAVGAAFANPRARIRLITGDGGLQLNIQEFATVRHHGLQISTYLFNNKGHGMCRQTQHQWLGATYPATSHAGGLACPDFRAIADAYGVQLEEIPIPFDAQLTPCVQSGRPNEDAHPLMDRDELRSQMLIPTWDEWMKNNVPGYDCQ